MGDWKQLLQEHLDGFEAAALPSRVKVPSLPEVLLTFNKKAEDPEASPLELAEIIETDSSLTCELLKLSNSAAMGTRKKVSSAQMAISLLGIRRTKYLLLSVTLENSMKSREWKLIHSRNFWTSNLERALFAREVAIWLEVDGDLAFAGGMLQDVLLPALTTDLFDSYIEFAKPDRQDERSLIDFEHEHFQWNHAQIAAFVMGGWGFPDDLVACVLFHHRGTEVLQDEQLGRTAVAAVAISGLLPDSFRQVPGGLLELLELDVKWPAFDLQTMAQRVDEQFQELAPANDSHLPLTKRLEQASASS